ncbi:hypothetical protein NIES4073_03000 (plasmid) [Kalymmatonema gypsitolerans NIES-4073]|jgi:hypothetical protein|nr:hypothetical protein [Scytonema hyalinum WJT4-NPBG1]BAZ19430.1 hypothetical protein NIES4073_03000 [Scytonema sp. NIES-4073]
MAENKRVRIESHIEAYLKTHAQRVLHKPASTMTPQDFSTLVNTLLYEHQLAHGFVKKIPFAGILEWLSGLIAVAPANLSLMPQRHQQQAPLTADQPEDLSFYSALGHLYEQEAA